uniref:RPA-interacting protein n=1 Tax=Myxine glutinosa TaxID=7769 RepID=UPI00358EA02E
MEVESNFQRTPDDWNQRRMNVRVPTQCAAHFPGWRGRCEATTPHWRDVYRQRCLLRLRNSRASHLDRFRAAGARGQIQMQNGDYYGNLPGETSLIEKVLFREWQALKAERQRAEGAPDFGEEERDEVERVTREEIRQEMLAKKCPANEYEANEHFYQASFLMQVKRFEEGDGLTYSPCGGSSLVNSPSSDGAVSAMDTDWR